MWWAYIRGGGLYSGWGLIVGGLRYICCSTLLPRRHVECVILINGSLVLVICLLLDQIGRSSMLHETIMCLTTSLDLGPFLGALFSQIWSILGRHAVTSTTVQTQQHSYW
jgi:hypothetical protein